MVGVALQGQQGQGRRGGDRLGQFAEDAPAAVVDAALVEDTVQQQALAFGNARLSPLAGAAQRRIAQAVGSTQEKLPSAQGQPMMVQSMSSVRAISGSSSGFRPRRLSKRAAVRCVSSAGRPRTACAKSTSAVGQTASSRPRQPVDPIRRPALFQRAQPLRNGAGKVLALQR